MRWGGVEVHDVSFEEFGGGAGTLVATCLWRTVILCDPVCGFERVAHGEGKASAHVGWISRVNPDDQ